jgi:hypothetical protein
VAALFNIHPWQLLRMDKLRRQWYEEVAERHREREALRLDTLLESIHTMLGG